MRLQNSPGRYVPGLLLLLLALSPTALARPAAPARGAAAARAVFDLTEFGAVGDGVTDDGPALQRAFDALAEAGGGTLRVPAGRYALVTPALKDFTGLADSVTIEGVPSSTTVDYTGQGAELSLGLNLVSEFYPQVGNRFAVQLSGLQNVLVKDLAFVGTPGVAIDALVTLSVVNVRHAAVRHCEFYGLSTQLGGAIVQAIRSGLHIEQTKFLGSTANSGVYAPVVENLEWKALTLTDVVFLDYGQRALFSKTGLSAPFSWVNVGNAAAVTADSPRREVVIRRTFLDEGGFVGLSCMPTRYSPPSAPIDLYYISGLRMNVSNLGTAGHYLYGPLGLLIENGHYGWSRRTDAAIYLLATGNGIIDRVTTEAAATRLRADSATRRLTVINSVYQDLASQAASTVVLNTARDEDDPVWYVRRQFTLTLGRDPDAAAHYYWSDLLLRCGADAECGAQGRAALAAYLAASPAPRFRLSGRVVDDDGAPVADASVRLSGSQAVETRTDAEGRYSFLDLPTSGTYTVAVSKRHYNLAAPSATFDKPNGDRTADFAARVNRHRISGQIVDAQNRAVAGVTVTLSGTRSATATTDAGGAYSFPDLPAGGTYAVTPSKPGHGFAPPTTGFADLSGDRTAAFTAAQPPVAEFTSAGYRFGEAAGAVQLTVTRRGETAAAASVIYTAVDVAARQGQDLNTVIGRLDFAPGETSKSLPLFIIDDAHAEGAEQLTLMLRDANGTAPPATATLTIEDNDDGQPRPNPADDARFFVRQHYRDFLGREPDQAGLDFWAGQIEDCGADAQCRRVRRVEVSAAFFLSIEFQETGFLTHRLYKASYGRVPRRVEEFLFDARLLSEGVVVGAPGWPEKLAANKRAFFQLWVQRPDFRARYDALDDARFADALYANMGITPTAAEREALLADLRGGVPRHEVLAKLVEGAEFSRRETSPAFVLMQYFGYLQRNPADAPDTNLDGYDFWLRKLNDSDGDWRRAEMVRAFVESIEYRRRFGQ